LHELIRPRYLTTTFIVGEVEDPGGVYLRAIVDADDTDEVTEVFIDRMIDRQVEDDLPIYAVPVRTPASSLPALVLNEAGTQGKGCLPSCRPR
jgi:hypothetical protein